MICKVKYRVEEDYIPSEKYIRVMKHHPEKIMDVEIDEPAAEEFPSFRLSASCLSL